MDVFYPEYGVFASLERDPFKLRVRFK